MGDGNFAVTMDKLSKYPSMITIKLRLSANRLGPASMKVFADDLNTRRDLKVLNVNLS